MNMRTDPAELAELIEENHTETKSVLEAAAKKQGEIGGKVEGLDARLHDIEQKLATRKGGGSDGPDSWGSQIVRQDEFKAVNSNTRGRWRFEVKTTATLTSASGGAAGDAGGLVAPDLQSSVITLAQRRLRMRDVFAPGRTVGNAIEWPRQTARSNNAATVAEGGPKPQSDMTFDLPSWPVRTLATWQLASKQILDDAPQLQSVIDADLRYDLAYVEDNQLLNGGGTGTDLLGVMTNATAFAAPITLSNAGNLTKIDIILLAIAQVQAADYDPDFIALNPLDVADYLSTKDDVGNYLGAGPFAAQAEILWRLPVVATKAMTVDNFLVGPGKRGAQIFDRQDATVELSTEDSDNFRKNLVTIRGEERLAFVIKHEAAFVKGTFTTALAAS
jgi:HK97 family phage major capsid protein